MNRNRYCEKSLVAFLVVRSKTLRTDGLDFDQECGKRGNGPRRKPTKALGPIRYVRSSLFL